MEQWFAGCFAIAQAEGDGVRCGACNCVAVSGGQPHHCRWVLSCLHKVVAVVV